MKWIALALLLCGCGDAADSQLVDLSDEPAGANCAGGGTAISVGFDRNGDGALQAEEVDTVEYVCDGEDGMDGDVPAPVLVETRPEDPGANCESGGIAIASGLDLDADGVLDPEEVQRTVYACNGTDGAAVLVETRPEPIGMNCTLGGTMILVGNDDDADGTLDPQEVTSTSFVCDGTLGSPTVLVGSFVVRNQLDVALLDGIVEITGGLLLDATGVEIELPALQRVGSIGSLGGAETLRAPNLVAAGSIFATFMIELPQLETVANELVVHRQPGGNIVLPELLSVGGQFHVFTTDTQRVSAPKLAMVGGPLIVTGSPQLTALELPALTTVSQIEIISAPLLATVVFGSIVDLPGGLSVFDCGPAVLPALATLETASVVGVGGLGQSEITMPDLHSLDDLFVLDGETTAVRFPSLQSVTGELDIRGESILELEMPAISSLGTNVRVDAPNLPECDVLAILAQANYTGPRTIVAAPCP
jgi:hypothetical protein